MINITRTNVTKGSTVLNNNQAFPMVPQSKSSFGKMKLGLEKTASGMTENTSSMDNEKLQKNSHFIETNN